MTEGGTVITLLVRRCEWCGHRCNGKACEYHRDLAKALANLYAGKP